MKPLQVDLEALAGEGLVRRVGRRRLSASTTANLKAAQGFFEGVREVDGSP